MGLRKYFAKRKFHQTPEPRGKIASSHKKLAFVVQEHHASRLHYDFRLELDGVLKSWAIPKGPSTNPHERRLAVMVEDHPFAYRNFEGIIPKGNYGAGEVIIWDKGTYEPRQETTQPEKELKKSLKKGHITFILQGEKLKGEYALIKLHGGEKNTWLLIKKGDAFASEKDVTNQAESVVSGRKIDDLNATPDIKKYPTSKPPSSVKPMLTTLIDAPFSQEGWLFEMKWDGYRAIGTMHKNNVELYSRNGLDFSHRYPEVTEALRGLKHDVVLDGEIAIVDENGRPHFELLQGWQTHKQGKLQYYVFDILWCDGHDVREMPLLQRKKLLQSILPVKPPFIYSDHVETEGEALFAAVQHQNLEGIIAKKMDSTYRVGIRAKDWLKIKTHQRQEVVIGGYTEGRGSREYIGALLLGVYEKDSLVFVGHANAGMPTEERLKLYKKLQRITRKTSPFTSEPKPNAVVHWVQPKFIGEATFSEWTNEGMMRHPQFEGLRPDKDPHDVHREKARTSEKAEQSKSVTRGSSRMAKPEFTHLDKIFWPKHGYTKGDLIKYYETIGETILPYLKDRPHSMNRQPGGINDRGFFQKDVSNLHLPRFAHSTTVHADSTGENVKYLVVKNLETLLYIIQLGSIEVNPWNSRVGALAHPDWGVMDLDPEGVTFKDVIKVAQTVHEVCEEWKVDHYAKTSGKTGIHIFIPMGAKYTYSQVRDFVHLVAIEVNKRQPKLTSLERQPKKRRHRVYLDYLQNSEGQTLAAPYSVRPTPDASVSAPLHWDEVKKNLRPEQFTIKNMPERLKKEGDLWKPVIGKGVNITKIIESIS